MCDRIPGMQERFPHFRRPSQFTPRATTDFRRQQRTKRSPAGVAQPQPDKVKEFMHKNPGKISWVPEETRFEHDTPLAKKRRGMNASALYAG